MLEFLGSYMIASVFGGGLILASVIYFLFFRGS